MTLKAMREAFRTVSEEVTWADVHIRNLSPPVTGRWREDGERGGAGG